MANRPVRTYHPFMIPMKFSREQAIGRRRFLIRLLGLGGLSAFSVPPVHAEKKAIRIGLTPVFLDYQVSFTVQWRQWLERKLGRPVVLIQRGNYRDIIDLILNGKIDFAWLCGYPYAHHRHKMHLVAVPLWRRQPYYQSYIIADARNIGIRMLSDLRGSVFAYSDPDSNSGYLYPQYALMSAGEKPASFFSRTFFTWAHRNVVEAVNVGLATGGAVDSYVWETLAETQPDITQGTRVIDKSPFFGYPPFVARGDIPQADLLQLRTVLLGMGKDPDGGRLLHKLRLDGFVQGDPGLYDGIVRMAERVRRP